MVGSVLGVFSGILGYQIFVVVVFSKYISVFFLHHQIENLATIKVGELCANV